MTVYDEISSIFIGHGFYPWPPMEAKYDITRAVFWPQDHPYGLFINTHQWVHIIIGFNIIYI